MTDDLCGADTTGDRPCQNPAGENGRCWIPSHNDPDAENPHGRPRTAPSKAQQEKIADVIEAGGSVAEACRKVGVHREQLRRWLSYGEEEPESPWGDLRDRLTRAHGEGEGRYREALIEIALEANDTATLMTMLKQRYPDEWGDVERGKQAGGVVVNLGEADEFEIDPETLEVVED